MSEAKVSPEASLLLRTMYKLRGGGAAGRYRSRSPLQPHAVVIGAGAVKSSPVTILSPTPSPAGLPVVSAATSAFSPTKESIERLKPSSTATVAALKLLKPVQCSGGASQGGGVNHLSPPSPLRRAYRSTQLPSSSSPPQSPSSPNPPPSPSSSPTASVSISTTPSSSPPPPQSQDATMQFYKFYSVASSGPPPSPQKNSWTCGWRELVTCLEYSSKKPVASGTTRVRPAWNAALKHALRALVCFLVCAAAALAAVSIAKVTKAEVAGVLHRIDVDALALSVAFRSGCAEKLSSLGASVSALTLAANVALSDLQFSLFAPPVPAPPSPPESPPVSAAPPSPPSSESGGRRAFFSSPRIYALDPMPDPPEPAALASLSPDDPILKSLLAGRRPVTRELRKGFKKVIKEILRDNEVGLERMRWDFEFEGEEDILEEEQEHLLV